MRTQLRPALVSVLAWTILLGFVFPGLVTLVANILFPFQAHGSLIVRNGRVVGSELIGQSFTLPIYFHPRPSAAGNGYDPTSSGGTNLAPTTDKLINGVHHGPKATDNFDGMKDLATAYRQENNLPSTMPLPTDAVTRSGSGLDPDISVENALLQADRVAKARGVEVSRVRRLIHDYTQPRQFGILGEPRVNVLRLNLALDRLYPVTKRQ
ncbi:K+-transporting ATPase, C subunit [Chthonomonas calidirosea]|uniref:Potassium-transporting ATPase KdpC subunit n=1 Tax=Chthonomonas calidirosea (strain DSM 23976 / ICMP 18418 / T49) TaxID=1303518 RepID=S0EZ13_CHTCT|nr:potassium-transporting ATPase subunit KdpC [Chthonomonas calidirosea]CCW35368.1 K+-transporting ATPase, C subunit [Chthonomonas calidirosea T49]CEK19505.1 K+-transporting ATPase, C subunit [Chthonomonas calidirosea]CEK20482.1 K+-transporting ATPase, C subunit [Chthonomonas calidirosea]